MLKETIASAFKFKGKREMDKRELTYTLSFDLKFFSHEMSKKVVELAEKKGVIVVDGNKVKPNFDLEGIEVFDFKPDVKKIFEEESKGIFDKIVREICEKTKKEFSEVIKEINKKQISLGNILDVEVVALILAAEIGIDIKDYINEVENEIFK